MKGAQQRTPRPRKAALPQPKAEQQDELSLMHSTLLMLAPNEATFNAVRLAHAVLTAADRDAAALALLRLMTLLTQADAPGGRAMVNIWAALQTGIYLKDAPAFFERVEVRLQL